MSDVLQYWRREVHYKMSENMELGLPVGWSRMWQKYNIKIVAREIQRARVSLTEVVQKRCDWKIFVKKVINFSKLITEVTILFKKTVLEKPCTLSYAMAKFRRDNTQR
jgi:hypothetical protein